jgi:hypothetical protein
MGMVFLGVSLVLSGQESTAGNETALPRTAILETCKSCAISESPTTRSQRYRYDLAAIDSSYANRSITAPLLPNTPVQWLMTT